MTAGAYPLLGVGGLPNVDIAFPGEVWSANRASGLIVPGSAVIPVSVGGRLYYKAVEAGDAGSIVKEQVGVALRQVEIPDVNTGPTALGPNEIVNQAIADLDYLRVYKSGALHLTLVEPRADYECGQLIGWDPAATRPVGKAAGDGAWTSVANGNPDADTAIFEVIEPGYRAYGDADEGVLTVRFLRSNN